MRTQLKPVKFTTREVRITQEMTTHQFIRTVRGAIAQIARDLGVTHSLVSAVVRGKKRSGRVERAIETWIHREIKRRHAA